MSRSEVHTRVFQKQEMLELSPEDQRAVFLASVLMKEGASHLDPFLMKVGWMTFCEVFDIPIKSELVDCSADEYTFTLSYTLPGEGDEA